MLEALREGHCGIGLGILTLLASDCRENRPSKWHGWPLSSHPAACGVGMGFGRDPGEPCQARAFLVVLSPRSAGRSPRD